MRGKTGTRLCGAGGVHDGLLLSELLSTLLPDTKKPADLSGLTTPFLHVKYAGPVLNEQWVGEGECGGGASLRKKRITADRGLL